MTDQAVIESFDSGADLNDSGSGGDQTSTESTQNEGSGGAGGGSEGQRTSADSGNKSAAGGSGAGAQSQSAGDAEGKDKFVPLSALQEARSELKALKAEIAELRNQPRLTPEEKQRLASLEQTQTAAQKDPDFLEDPKGYIDTKLTKAQEALKKLDEAEAGRKKQEEQQRTVQTIVSNIGAKEQEFVKSTPDYNDALAHARSVRAQQLALIYPNATPQQITQQIGNEELSAAAQVLQSGGDPAAFAYAYAKTLGYAPKAPAAAANNQQAAANGQKPADKDAARSLGGGGGADSTPEPEENPMEDAFNNALAERFGVKKRK